MLTAPELWIQYSHLAEGGFGRVMWESDFTELYKFLSSSKLHTNPLECEGWYQDLGKIAESLHPVLNWGAPSAQYAHGLVGLAARRIKELEAQLEAIKNPKTNQGDLNE